jgi:hypothetical protein
MHEAHEPLTVGVPRVETSDGIVRVTADVDGTDVWFETVDAPLRPAPEAWGSGLLVPGLHAGRRLALPSAPDPVWLGNVTRLLSIFERWWGTPLLPPGAPRAEPAGHSEREPRPGRPTGVFFSAGIDSFHALLRSGHDVRTLVHVQGFDIDLDDTSRLERVEASVRDVARTLGISAIVVRTNLRYHPLMRAMNWERTHGGAMAAVAHALGGELERVLIASSFPRRFPGPWGSHWMTDPLWSSGSIELVHVGAEGGRLYKARAIVHEPIVLEHLHVCYKNVDGVLNCSRCEKCLFTLLTLAEAGVLDRCPTLDGRDLLARIEALPSMRWRRPGLVQLALSNRLERRLRLAVAKLLLRSELKDSWPGRAARSLARRLKSRGV